MDSIVQPYSVDHFNTLPEIMDSDAVVKTRCTSEVFSSLGQTFFDHEVQDVFGLALVHQHFDLESNERLVSFDNVAVPVKQEGLDFPYAASRWAFAGDKLFPYEYAAGGSSSNPESYKGFVQQLHEILSAHDLHKHLGICTISSIQTPTSSPTIEFTSGRVNVTLPIDLNLDGGSRVDASWQICSRTDSEMLGPVVFGQCKNRCVGPSGKHPTRHMFS